MVVNGDEVDYTHETEIYDKDGNIAAKVVYKPSDPVLGQAVVWIETVNEVNNITHEGE